MPRRNCQQDPVLRAQFAANDRIDELEELEESRSQRDGEDGRQEANHEREQQFYDDIAIYNRAEDGYTPWAIVVLEMSGGAITGLHHFLYPELFAEFGLPPRLDREDAGQSDELQQPA